MGQPQARKKQHKGDKPLKEKYRTKRKTKDLDEIFEDLKPESFSSLLNQKVDYDKVGNGQFYCVHCARYFIDNRALKDHLKTKVHKKRLKRLQMEPYTQAEAERAAGMGSYIAPKKANIPTQLLPEKMDDSEDITGRD